MELESPEPDRVTDLLPTVMSSCMNYFDILDLVHISCSSRCLKELCQSKLREGSRQRAHNLLVEFVQAAAKSSEIEEELGKLQIQNAKVPMEAVVWLLDTSGLRFSSTMDPVTEETANHLLYTSNIPILNTTVLVAAGLRYTYTQLTAAARSGVRGLHVWIQAMCMAGKHSGMPEYAQIMWYPQEDAMNRLLKVSPVITRD